MPSLSLRAPLARWIARYGAAEAVGTCTALGGAWLAHALGGNEVVVAYAGALGENVGYYGTIAWRELRCAHRVARAAGARLGARDVAVACRELVIEFGPAEVLDSLVVRPLAMGLGTRWLGGGIGIVAGKLAADLLFYLPVIATWESRRHARGASSPSPRA